MKTHTRNNPSHERPTESQRTNDRGTGADSSKTRSPMPATQELKAASGKQNNSPR